MSPKKKNKRMVLQDPCSQGTASTIYFSADSVPVQNEGVDSEATQSQEWVNCNDKDNDEVLSEVSVISLIEKGRNSSNFEECTKLYEKDVDLTCIDNKLCEATCSQEKAKCSNKEIDKIVTERSVTSLAEKGNDSSEFEECTKIYEKDVALTCIDIKQFRVTLVSDCSEDIPCASFKGGDRDINVTVDQLSRFVKEPTIYLEAKIVSVMPILKKGAEVEGLSLKCRQCKRIQIWEEAMRNSEDGKSPICSNKSCGRAKLGSPTFVFKFSLAHGAGNSSALLMKEQARHFFGFTEEEFVRRKEVRERLRMDLEELVESDLVFQFSLKVVEGDIPFVYLIHNMRVVRI